jgi:hypothetical protein
MICTGFFNVSEILFALFIGIVKYQLLWNQLKCPLSHMPKWLRSWIFRIWGWMKFRHVWTHSLKLEECFSQACLHKGISPPVRKLELRAPPQNYIWLGFQMKNEEYFSMYTAMYYYFILVWQGLHILILSDVIKLLCKTYCNVYGFLKTRFGLVICFINNPQVVNYK